MKKKSSFLIYPLILMGVLLLSVNARMDNKISKSEILTVQDYDGNVYHTVVIGKQIWMVENLNVTHYRNGDPIPNITDSATWCHLTTGAYCDYANDPSNSKTYGRLYNWYAVTDNRNIAPPGWHIPSDSEWNILITYFGPDSIAGTKLKEKDTIHWKGLVKKAANDTGKVNKSFVPETGATNESGFTALPGGQRYYYCYYFKEGFGDIRKIGNWWTTTARDTTHLPEYIKLRDKLFPETRQMIVYSRKLMYRVKLAYRFPGYKNDGFSVRCIKD